MPDVSNIGILGDFYHFAVYLLQQEATRIAEKADTELGTKASEVLFLSIDENAAAIAGSAHGLAAYYGEAQGTLLGVRMFAE